jgi:SAM-dependent methyltransferase
MDYFGNSRARYLKTLDAIPEDIAVNKAAKILDIGGYSVFENMMIERYGFENLKTFATPNLNVDTLDFENNSFDLIILGEVIEHLYDPDIILQECSRILKPNGVLLITTPNLLSWYNRILMVFGYYPMNLDISCEVRRTGKRDILQKRPIENVQLNPLYDVHIKLYTFATLDILLRGHGFGQLSKSSYSLDRSAHFRINFILKFVNSIFSRINNLAQGIIILGRKT